MDKEQQIDIKLIRYLSGTANPAEKKEVLAWVKQSDRNQYEFERLKAFWKLETEDQKLIHHEELKAKIWNAYNRGHQNKFKRWGGNKAWYRVAAAISFLLVASIIFVNRASIFSASKPTPVTLLSKENPRGQKSQFQLPDGSKVWLNAESKISFPEIFSDTARLVTLEGEAFFDVKKDPLKPFIVKIGDLNVKVLGTEFNVEGYNGEDQIRVVLVEGSVKIHHNKINQEDGIVLRPGMGLAFTKSLIAYRKFSKEENPETFNKAIFWRNGKLIFDGANLSTFVKEISRWYGVSVEIRGIPEKSWDLIGTFENEYLTNILDGVSYNKGFKYELKDKKLTLMFH